MEAWLSELEMEWKNDEHMQNMDTLFNEELALILGDDFPSLMPTNNPHQNLNDNLFRTPSTEQLYPSVYHNVDNNNNNPIYLPQQHQISPENQDGKDDDSPNNKQQDANGGKRKRRREPSQVYDHIMAERKRRELIAQRFIALSAIVPGLEKVDKTSILGETINYLKQLKEKVKGLEETVAKQNVESMVVVKRSKLVLDNNDDDDDDDEGASACTNNNNGGSGGGGGGGGGGGQYEEDSLADIEVKVLNNNLSVRLYCEKRKGISAKILTEVEKHDLSILNSSIALCGDSVFNIFILAQTEKVEKKHVKKTRFKSPQNSQQKLIDFATVV